MALPALALLAACTSAQDVLDVKAAGPSPPATLGSASTPTTATSSTTTATGSTAQTEQAPRTASVASPANIRTARLEFAPIVGTSVEAAKTLSQGLTARARLRGMTLVGTGDASRTQMLKGYFTPLKEGGETTVIFVWDVYDLSGNRVHRISGQKKAVSAAGEGWASVSSSTMEAIAETTIDQLASWLSTLPG